MPAIRLSAAVFMVYCTYGGLFAFLFLAPPDNLRERIFMGKYDGFLICSDCDGTLTNNKGQISEENARAIRCFQENGGLFTVATGRFPTYINHFLPSFRPNTLVIGLNGTVLCDLETGKTVCGSPLGNEYGEVLRYVAGQVGFDAEIYVYSAADIVSLHSRDTEKLSALLLGQSGPVYKILFCQEEQNILALKKQLEERFQGRYLFDRSWPLGLEMHRRGSGKGAYVRRLKEYLEGRVHTTVCVGDYENDISMIEEADIGYAVGNAADAVKQAADRVTAPNDADAIAAIIREL